MSDSAAITQSWATRMLGLVVIVVTLVWYEPGASGAVQRLVLPLVMALGAWWLVRNLAAVALGASVLATIHSNPGSADWISGYAYPAVALASAAVLLWIVRDRFRERIAATHEARWRARRGNAGD